MIPPRSADLPFFAYGLFRPGQLAFFQLRELVSNISDPVEVPGTLLLRDGLPILDPAGRDRVTGSLITFASGRSEEAYRRVAAMEPDKHYLWHKTDINGKSANILIGRSPRRGSVACEDRDWNGWNDPLFTAAIDVVEEYRQSQQFDWDLKPLFRLQMAYLLLWSSIERYISLRYYLGTDVMSRISKLADDEGFLSSLQDCVKETRVVYRADRPGERVVLDPISPAKAVKYYYQVRSNIVHRGKGILRDFDVLQKSLSELLTISRTVLVRAQQDAAAPLKSANLTLV